jgi:heme oxygenase
LRRQASLKGYNTKYMLQKILKEATQNNHAELEKLMFADQIMNGTLTIYQYKQIVTTNYLVHKLLEEYLITALRPETADKLNMESRRKLDSLTADINGLKMIIPSHKFDTHNIIFENDASILGALYVLEGSTLGGNVIVKKLKINPNLSSLHLDFHYYQIYGSNLIQYWKEFCEILNIQPLHTYSNSIDGAKRMFEFIAFVQQSVLKMH